MLSGVDCSAQSQFSSSITRMEKSLFGVDYSNQPDEARLDRLEKTVYGAASKSPTSQRLGKLSNDLSADLLGQEIKPKTDTFEEEEKSPQEAIPKADSNVRYPIVDKLESEVFSKQFKTIDITQRLANLEQKVFKKAYNDDLNARVERLKVAVMPKQRADNFVDTDDSDLLSQNSSPEDIINRDYPPEHDYFNGAPDNYAQRPGYNSNNSVLDDYQASSDIDIPLAVVEKKVLKKTFPDDTVSNRLTRLELKIFNSQFVDDDEQTRLERIASAYQAKKTSAKYDSNKFSQHMSTAVQVGAFLLMILAAVL